MENKKFSVVNNRMDFNIIDRGFEGNNRQSRTFPYTVLFRSAVWSSGTENDRQPASKAVHQAYSGGWDDDGYFVIFK